MPKLIQVFLKMTVTVCEKNAIMSDIGLLHSRTDIPRGPSGNMSRVAVGTGGGTVGVGVGAIHI